eukprot:Em0004g1700a
MPLFNVHLCSAQLPLCITCQLYSELYTDPEFFHVTTLLVGSVFIRRWRGLGDKQNMDWSALSRIPLGGVIATPQNLHLGFEVEVAGYMSKIGSDGEKSCDACIDRSMGPAVVFCCTCYHLRCKLCHKCERIWFHPPQR